MLQLVEAQKVRTKPAKGRGRPFMARPVAFFLQLGVCATIVSSFFYWFGNYVQESGLFNIKTIVVDGADFLSENDIIALSGVTSGDCIFLVNSEDVARKVKRIPFVSECRVNRTFPDRIEITIKERVELATLLVNNRLFGLDQDCNVLRELGNEEAHIGPFITDAEELATVEVGQRLERPAIRNALSVWRAFARTSMAQDVTVSEINSENDSKISMTCDELNCEIRWGSDNIESQAWKLDVFWRSEKGHTPFREYIDLRFGNDVACR